MSVFCKYFRYTKKEEGSVWADYRDLPKKPIKKKV